MRITFELEEADIARFHAALRRARAAADCADEVEIVEAAKYALDHLPIASAPAYVRKQMAEVQKLIVMLEDEAWGLPQPERGEVLEALLYLSDPDDLIPDHIEVIGLLDDAIMLELLLHRLRAVRKAYVDFRARRAELPREGSRQGRARAVADLRQRLFARMRRTQARAAAKAR
jgi:uncharacterized membrane protein YkvA (DUF1232 family)